MFRTLKKLIKKGEPLDNLKKKLSILKQKPSIPELHTQEPAFFIDFCMEGSPDQVSKTAEGIIKNFFKHYSKSLKKPSEVRPFFTTRRDPIDYTKSKAGTSLPLVIFSSFVEYMVWSYQLNISKITIDRFDIPNAKDISILILIINLKLHTKDGKASNPLSSGININNLGGLANVEN